MAGQKKAAEAKGAVSGMQFCETDYTDLSATMFLLRTVPRTQLTSQLIVPIIKQTPHILMRFFVTASPAMNGDN